MARFSFDIQQLSCLADLMMGAAHADGEFDVFEAEAIHDTLVDLLGDQPLPEALSRRLAAFEPEDLSIPDACRRLGLTDRHQRDAVIGLLMEITHAESVQDAAENSYLLGVAEALGEPLDEVEVEEIDVIVLTDVVPPPVPGES